METLTSRALDFATVNAVTGALFGAFVLLVLVLASLPPERSVARIPRRYIGRGSRR